MTECQPEEPVDGSVHLVPAVDKRSHYALDAHGVQYEEWINISDESTNHSNASDAQSESGIEHDRKHKREKNKEKWNTPL